MIRSPLLLTALIVIGLLSHGALNAADMPAPVVAEAADSVAVAEKRSGGIMSSLALTDADQAARVKQHIVNFVITLKNLHKGKTPPVGEAKRDALIAARDSLYAGLEAEKLTDDQKLIIKNGLCANHYMINYEAFLFLVPKLTEEEKAHIRTELATAFDDAIVMNSGEAKGSAFHKARGRVNIYLSKQGYDLKALSVERNARIKAEKPATQPSTAPAK